MNIISRRNFIKKTLAGAALLAIGNINLPVSKSKEKVLFCVDEAGNAFLRGADMNVDTQGNANLELKWVEMLCVK